MAWDYPMFFMFDQSVNYCCRAPRIRIPDEDMDKYGSDLFSNHPVFQERRRSLLSGFKDPSCETCWQLEEKGFKSQRRPDLFMPMMNIMHDLPNDRKLLDSHDWSDTKYLDTDYTNVVEIVLNNTCDAKCVYCNETFSSQWMSEKKKFGEVSKDYEIFGERNPKLEKLFWEWFEERTKTRPINRVGFIGGEPFITDELYECLDKIIEIVSKHKPRKGELCITTNGSTPPKYFEKWLKYSERLEPYFKIIVQVSGESVEDRLEYIRNGVKWERWKRNIEMYASNERFQLAFLPCISLLSIPKLEDYLNFVFSIYRKTGRLFSLYENSATWPEEISVMSLPSDMVYLLDPAIKALEEFIKEIKPLDTKDQYTTKAKASYQGFLGFLHRIREGNLKNKPLAERVDETHETVKFLRILDSRRATDFKQTFPEFAIFGDVEVHPTKKIIPIMAETKKTYQEMKFVPKGNIRARMPEVEFGKQVLPEDVICRFKWDYPIVNLMSGHVRGCCRTPKQVITAEQIKEYGTDVIMNLPYEQDRRREKLLGITHKDCESCIRLEYDNSHPPKTGMTRFVNEYLIERKGMWDKKIQNTKQFFLDNVPQTADQLPYNHPLLRSDKPDMLEIILGNHCDQKCTYCSMHYSTSWVNELVKFGEVAKEEVPSHFPEAPPELEKVFWEWFYDVGRHEARTINILGGEPTYMPKFYDVMEKLIHAYGDLGKKDRHVELGILSNMNTKPILMDRFCALLPRLTEHLYVRLQPSCEALYRKAEYIRFGLEWSRFEGNIRRLLGNRERYGLTEHNFGLGFQIAVNTFSLSSLPDYLKWVQSLTDEYDFKLGLYPNVVSFPRHHNPHILPQRYANFYKEAYFFVKRHAAENDVVVNKQMRDLGIQNGGSWSHYADHFLRWEWHSMDKPERTEFDLESRAHFFAFIKKMKVRREVDFLDYFPDMVDFYELCEKEYLEREFYDRVE